jgi:hypothetical protein
MGAERLGEARDRERLGDPGHALEQHVAVGEQADQEALQHVALADDDRLHGRQQIAGELALLG